jgi:hypothetical protein
VQSEPKKAEWKEEDGSKHEKVKELEKGARREKKRVEERDEARVFLCFAARRGEAIALAQSVLERAKPELWTS